MREIVGNQTPLATVRAQRWHAHHTYRSASLPGVATLLARKRAEGQSIAVVLPALNEEATIGRICRTISNELMLRVPLVDELLVIDGGSSDATAFEARAGGAQVFDVATILPEIPRVEGKGESLWRSLAETKSDIVVWIDADIRNFGSHFVTRLVAPLLMRPDLAFTKAFYRRPLAEGGVMLPSGGGRVTELLARPMLNALFPELAGFLQPLSGEYAGRRGVLERLPFFTGYSVEAGLLIDLLQTTGLDSMAQVDLEERIHRNRPIEELSPMAYAIGTTIMRRAEEWGRLRAAIDFPTAPLLQPCAEGAVEARRIVEIERPPMELVPAYLEAVRSNLTAAAVMP